MHMPIFLCRNLSIFSWKVNKRIYLAGLATDCNYKRAYAEFAAAKEFVINQGVDEVIYPCELVSAGTACTEAMLTLLPYLASINFLALLPGYIGSNGAMSEYFFGREMEKENLPVILYLKIYKKGTILLLFENNDILKHSI